MTMIYRALDMDGNPIFLGSLVEVSYKTQQLHAKKQVIDTVKEVVFRADGMTYIRIKGPSSKLINTHDAKLVNVNEGEGYLLQAFASKGVSVSLSEVRNIVSAVSALSTLGNDVIIGGEVDE